LAGALPQTPLGSSQHSPRLFSCISRGLNFKKNKRKEKKTGETIKEEERDKRKEKGEREEKEQGFNTRFWLGH